LIADAEVHDEIAELTFIDMGGEYPNNSFTGVIFASAMGTVGDVSDLARKTVDTRLRGSDRTLVPLTAALGDRVGLR